MIDQQINKLRPCPFCGASPKIIKRGIPFDVGKPPEIAQCNCGVFLNAKRWNTRPLEDALQSAIKELKLALHEINAKYDLEQKEFNMGVRARDAGLTLDDEPDGLRSDEWRIGWVWEAYNTVKSELDYMTKYADKLAEGFPEGMLPKDIQVIKDANWKLAQEIFDLKQSVKDAVEDMHKYCLRPSYVAGDALTLIGIENILHKHGLIEEDK